MAIKEDIAKAITQNLSAEVGTALKAQLERLEQLEKRVEQYEVTNAKSLKEASDREVLIAQLKVDLSKHTALAVREVNVTNREMAAENQDLKYQLAAEQRVAKTYEGAVAGMVRNVEWRNAIYKETPIARATPVYQNGMQISGGDFVEQHKTSEVTSSEAK